MGVREFPGWPPLCLALANASLTVFNELPFYWPQSLTLDSFPSFALFQFMSSWQAHGGPAKDVGQTSCYRSDWDY